MFSFPKIVAKNAKSPVINDLMLKDKKVLLFCNAGGSSARVTSQEWQAP